MITSKFIRSSYHESWEICRNFISSCFLGCISDTDIIVSVQNSSGICSRQQLAGWQDAIPNPAKNTSNKQTLTPALRELIKACFTLQITSTKVLAAYLQRSSATIRTDLQRIRIIFGKHNKHTSWSAITKLSTAVYKTG